MPWWRARPCPTSELSTLSSWPVRMRALTPVPISRNSCVMLIDCSFSKILNTWALSGLKINFTWKVKLDVYSRLTNKSINTLKLIFSVWFFVGFKWRAIISPSLFLQLQTDIGDRAPSYLRDLIGRLSTFSDEPRLAGLVGFVVTLLVDMVYTSSKHSSGRGKLAGSSSSQVNLFRQRWWKRCEFYNRHA